MRKLSWSEIVSILNSGEHALLWGPPGTGKTSIAFLTAASRPVSSVTMTLETPAAELRGHYIPHGSEFQWHDGPAIRSWRAGGRLILDEIDQTSGDCMTLLYAICNDRSVARLTLPTGETVSPAAGFQVIATTNVDPSRVLPEALLDRFSVRINVADPHPDALKSVANPGLRQIIAASIGKGPTEKISLRQALAFERMIGAGVSESAAARAVFHNFADAAMLASRAGIKRED